MVKLFTRSVTQCVQQKFCVSEEKEMVRSILNILSVRWLWAIQTDENNKYLYGFYYVLCIILGTKHTKSFKLHKNLMKKVLILSLLCSQGNWGMGMVWFDPVK